MPARHRSLEHFHKGFHVKLTAIEHGTVERYVCRDGYRGFDFFFGRPRCARESSMGRDAIDALHCHRGRYGRQLSVLQWNRAVENILLDRGVIRLSSSLLRFRSVQQGRFALDRTPRTAKDARPERTNSPPTKCLDHLLYRHAAREQIGFKRSVQPAITKKRHLRVEVMNSMIILETP